MGESSVGAGTFPGFVIPSNQKWRINLAAERDIARAVRAGVPGWEAHRRIYDSDFEQLRVIVAWHPGFGWHLSISHPARYPTWEEIKAARYELLPDACTMGLLLPPAAEYVNLHPNCFHLHQVPDDPGGAHG